MKTCPWACRGMQHDSDILLLKSQRRADLLQLQVANVRVRVWGCVEGRLYAVASPGSRERLQEGPLLPA